MPEQVQLQTRLLLSRKGSQYEVLIIRAGQTQPTSGYSDGLLIPVETLKTSVPLWENAQSFVDHTWGAHSLRDLCGVFTQPEWDESNHGIKAIFTPFGPGKEVALAVAEDVLDHPELSEQVGFSADFYFEQEQGTGGGHPPLQGGDSHIPTVLKIVQANSADLVIKPAAGGKWLRVLNSIRHAESALTTTPAEERGTRDTPDTTENTKKEQGKMKIFNFDTPDEGTPSTPAPGANPALHHGAGQAISESRVTLSRLQAVTESTQTQTALIKLDEANAAAQRLQIQMCQALLQTTLAGSRLPEAWQERIRNDFGERAFNAEELTNRIEADRQLLSITTAGGAVRGPATVHGMFSADDQIRAAVEDMFGLEQDAALKGCQPARLSGIRELYLLLTGDYDLHGEINLGRAQFQLSTTNFTVLVKNALNKALARHWESFGKAGYDWWTQIATVEHFTSLNDITWSIFGTVGSLPTVAEGAEYTPLKIGDGGETSSFVKKGGYVGLTLVAIDRDDLAALKRLPKELAFAGIREISAAVAAIFTTASGVGPTLADTGALFNATAVTTAGGHKNLLTTALGTDYTAWEAVAAAMYVQPMLVANETGYIGLGKAMAIEPKFCLVPRALRGAANTLFVARQIAAGNDNMYYGQVFPITVPEWTDTTDWAAVADPKLVPGIMVGERFGLMPEIFVAGNESDPAVFMNDESRIKVRHFTAVGVCDYRPLHKSNVAGG